MSSLMNSWKISLTPSGTPSSSILSLDVAIEGVESHDRVLATELEVDAGIESERRLLVESRVAEDALLVVDDERRVQLVEVRAPDRPGHGQAQLGSVGRVPTEMGARVELEEVLGRLDLVAVDDVDADGREFVCRLRKRLGNRRIEVEASELCAAAELQRRRVVEIHRPLDEAIRALVLGVEQRKPVVVLLQHAVLVLEHAEGEVALLVDALEPELELRARKLVFDGSPQLELGVVGIRDFLAVEEFGVAQVFGIGAERSAKRSMMS